MAKTAEKSTTAVREFRAEAKFQRTSPQKAKLVLDTIKGQRVEQALNTLMFTRKRVAPIVEKALRSAVQNANYLSQEQGFDLDVDNLFVKQAVANEGPRMKRIRPAPMGRAYRYQRRIAHIIVTVAEKQSKGGQQGTEATSKAVATGKTSGKATTKKASNKKSAGAAA
ncbi:50S ribosomal protein L22 [Terriglobus aquaticus]|uniref:Large ribosomal subunit protein uL22 n=1 Tax=Terriglobus aquaticus TaxID=940139 RepID=A0ABW9KP76_9BACT|nr:50S ribosomal protein L22 [Terriglobus aquaticus]